MTGAGGGATAARRGAGFSRSDPDRRGADRALDHPAQRRSAACGRASGACRRRHHRDRRCRHRGRADQGHGGRSDASMRGEGSASSSAGATPPRSSSRSCSGSIGLYLRPDFWGSLDNTFNLILSFTEVALALDRPDLRHRQWRHRPLGRLGAGAFGRDCRLLHEAAGLDPWARHVIALLGGRAGRLRQCAW